MCQLQTTRYSPKLMSNIKWSLVLECRLNDHSGAFLHVCLFKEGPYDGSELGEQREQSLTLKFRQDTTTSPFGVMIGTFSHTMPLSTSITTPEEERRQKDRERKKNVRASEQRIRLECGYRWDNTFIAGIMGLRIKNLSLLLYLSHSLTVLSFIHSGVKWMFTQGYLFNESGLWPRGRSLLVMSCWWSRNLFCLCKLLHIQVWINAWHLDRKCILKVQKIRTKQTWQQHLSGCGVCIWPIRLVSTCFSFRLMLMHTEVWVCVHRRTSPPFISSGPSICISGLLFCSAPAVADREERL